MFTSPLKMAGVFVAVLASANLASADPGKGSRWGDFAFGPSRTTTTRAVPVQYAVPGPAVAAQPSTASAAQTITIVGSDGVARSYPVVGGVVQQLPTQSTVGAQSGNGGIQAAPAVSGMSTNPAVVIPSTQRVPLFPRLRR